MGWQAAAHALFTAGWFDAEEAVASGLARRICAPDDLVDEALELARTIARMPIVSLRRSSGSGPSRTERTGPDPRGRFSAGTMPLGYP
jgi:enoyl-CoA hydratase/carnithine racemase